MFEFCTLGLSHLDEVLALEAEVFFGLGQTGLLRRNTVAAWQASLCAPHVAMGVRAGTRLAACAVLYLPEKGDGEDLSALLQGAEVGTRKSANYKICMVAPEFRGNSLQVRLGRRLEEEARRLGVSLLCSTASPRNAASIDNLLRLGYRYDRTLEKYGFMRNLYYKYL